MKEYRCEKRKVAWITVTSEREQQQEQEQEQQQTASMWHINT